MQFSSVHEQISFVASQMPQKAAIEWGERRVSYLELEIMASQIANFLHGRIAERKNIALMFENSIELIEAILGVLKSGGGFAPLDPGFPENRIKLMVTEIDAEWVLTRSSYLDKLEQMMENGDRTINALVLDSVEVASDPATNTTDSMKNYKNINIYTLDAELAKECLFQLEPQKNCYVYFTSGSTGKPKAILGRHKSLKHFIDWEIGEFGINDTSKVSQLISPSFDPFLRDVFVPLCAGATLCIPEDRDVILYPERLQAWIDEKQITLTHMVPTVFKALMAELEDANSLASLKYILLAGELLRGNDVKKFFQLFGGRIQLVNLYGPTETTLAKLFYRVQESDAERVSVPVGKPIPGAQVMILDEDMQSCLNGTIGEIYIRTPYITSGYYNDRELTRQVFIKNPFSENAQDIIYKTGDLGRILQTGDVEILGRADFQVKLRGMRIELGEIENQLLQLGVKEAVVVAKEDEDGQKFLCAYYISASELTPGELREKLARELPEYMVPAYFIQLAKMPLTPNGKIDRKALPQPEMGTGVEYIAPETSTEEVLVQIWTEVLGTENIGVQHNFFDLGGHSLKAATIVTKIHKELNVDVPLKEIFLNPTIKQLAASIETAEENLYASIKPTPEREYYPVSSAQRRIYVLNQLEQGSLSYNFPRVLTVSGNLERERLENSIKALIQRHETLRSSFHTINGEIVQKIHPETNFQLTYSEAAKDQVQSLVREFFQPFNLEKAPLLRVGLIHVAGEDDVLLFDTHHIISDGTSMDILVRDFVCLYEGQELPHLPIQYKDFAVWQNELFASGVMDSQEQYWLKNFEGPIPVLDLPTDYPRPATQSFLGDILQFRADSLLARQLNDLAKANGTTLYMVLLAAYNVLLARYTGQDDIIVGSPLAGRPHGDLENIIGMFINTLAMRNYPRAGLTFKEFLREVRTNALKAYENQDYQFEQLVNKLNVPRDLSRNPIFDTLLVLHNYDHADLALEGLGFKFYPLEKTMSKFDLTISAEEWNNQIAFNLEYCTRLFKRETIERLAGHYLSILQQVVSNAEVRLAEIDILSADEREKVMIEFNNTQLDYPADKTIHQLIEEQVARTPDDTALVFQDTLLTYGQLNSRANQLAGMLRAKGVQPDTAVALMVERSLEMLIGILGILKAGAAYLPIDPDYPTDRIQYVLADSGARIILSEERCLNSLSNVGVEIIRIDQEEAYADTVDNLQLVNSSQDLAYIIYTSGSTGQPKGVMIEHRSVSNFIAGITALIDFRVGKSVLALTTVSFDIFGLETLLPLTKGLKVVIATDEHQKDPRALKLVIERNAIDMLQMTPSRMRMLLSDEISASCLQGVQEILIGGEALPPALLKEIRTVTNAKIYNMYGPTETTIWSTMKDLTDTNDVTIGRPIANTQVYIVGAENTLQPIGVPGELCIAGAGLARGYWQRPELTAEKFVSNPFISASDRPENQARMYRTGDRARWLANGEIEFFGRNDEQVKIRGFRIEPGEIENQLLNHPAVTEVVVIARDDNSGGKYLCAYLVGEGELHIPELKAHLSKNLPDYMIPTFFIQLEALPYTPNGKINRKVLPAPDAGMVSGVQYEPPKTEIEAKLIAIWQEALGIEGIGIHHNFFEIGGNSINIVKVISMISKRMGIQVPMGELFLHPTIAEIANNMFLENPLEGFDCTVRMNKPAPDKPNIFILHTWEGIIYQYKEIAKQLEGEYNVYGIQAKGVTKPAKLPETLEEMVTDYIVEMKAIQPEGPYIIAGYCYGNWIAYKMVQMLEDQNVPIDRLILIDENAWIPDEIRKSYEMMTKATAPIRFIKKWVRKLITRRNKNPMDYWPTLLAYQKSKPAITGEIKNAMTVRENVNRLCTVGYRLDHLISNDVYIIKAEENNLVRYTPEDWKKQTSGKVWFVEIPGGHESIFAYPYVQGLVKAFRRSLVE